MKNRFRPHKATALGILFLMGASASNRSLASVVRTSENSTNSMPATSSIEQKRSPIAVPVIAAEPVGGGERGGGDHCKAVIQNSLIQIATDLQNFPKTIQLMDASGKAVDPSVFSTIVNDPKFAATPFVPSDEEPKMMALSQDVPPKLEPADFRNDPTAKSLEFIDGACDNYNNNQWIFQRMMIHELCGLAKIPDPKFKTSDVIQGWELQNAGHSMQASNVIFPENYPQKVVIDIIQSNPRSLVGRLKTVLRDLKNTPDSTLASQITDTIDGNMKSQSTKGDNPFSLEQQETLTFGDDPSRAQNAHAPRFFASIGPYKPNGTQDPTADKLKLHLEMNRKDFISLNTWKIAGSDDALAFKGTGAQEFYGLLHEVTKVENEYTGDPKKHPHARQVAIMEGSIKDENGQYIKYKYTIQCIHDLQPIDAYSCSLIFSN
jgi:hypothetical protein